MPISSYIGQDSNIFRVNSVGPVLLTSDKLGPRIAVGEIGPFVESELILSPKDAASFAFQKSVDEKDIVSSFFPIC